MPYAVSNSRMIIAHFSFFSTYIISKFARAEIRFHITVLFTLCFLLCGTGKSLCHNYFSRCFR